MKFEIGDDVDKKLVSVLFHEFLMCEEAFEKFVLFAGNNIMGSSESNIKLKSYNSYSEFLSRLYEFYVGCFKREYRNTENIDHEALDSLFTSEAEKLIRKRRIEIEKGYAPDWENYISYYQESVPSQFGKDFRDVRNNTLHTDYRRAGGHRIGLMEFYKKYHKFVHLLYYSALLAWSEKTHKEQKIQHVEEFDFLGNGN
ncbi:hypothetical protein ACNSTU_07245 [Aquisalimonas sp. APHAB1-3]|uniref:hypothetical protein n=1 Tax=Aquisalimonas sp. APHAB1-3 TaxID=3402080 RepID=UPI003AAA71ED